MLIENDFLFGFDAVAPLISVNILYNNNKYMCSPNKIKLI